MQYILLFLTIIPLVVNIVHIVTFLFLGFRVGLSIAPEFFLDTNEAIAQSLYLCVSLWQSGFFFVLLIINTNS